MKGFLKVVVGVAVPLLAIWLLIVAIGWRPGEAPDPVALRTDPPTGAAVELVGAPAGTWTLADDSDQLVGYRVVEHYPRLSEPATGAGRSDEVEATMVIEETLLTEVEVVADLRALESDRQNRDRAVRGRYLDTEAHPYATFTLTEPVQLAGIAAPGRPFTVDAVGDLTLRGETRQVTIPLEARWEGTRVQIIGELAINLPDFGIPVPDISGFVRVEEDGIMELDLTFAQVEAAG